MTSVVSQEYPKVNLYGDRYHKCQETASKFEGSEIGKYYKECMCLKDVGGMQPGNNTLKKHYGSISPYTVEDWDEVSSHQQKKKCVLPKGHTGRCSCKMDIFIPSPTSDKVTIKIEKSIYMTPGADDYLVKNRGSRLHPIAITKEQEKKIRGSWSEGMKSKKLKCAIPLKEQSTPFMVASAYLDYIVSTCSIQGMEDHINKESRHFQLCKDMLTKHKGFLEGYFEKFNRKIFDSDGHTICSVLGCKLRVEDFADPERDNRTDIRPTDIQMGHISSRCEDCYTVYGTNIVMMTRRGNLIIGEHSFIEDTWINELKGICSFHHS